MKLEQCPNCGDRKGVCSTPANAVRCYCCGWITEKFPTFREAADVWNRTSRELIKKKMEKIEKFGRWISVEDRLPNEPTNTVVLLSNLEMVICPWIFDRGQPQWGFEAYQCARGVDIVAWWPLPDNAMEVVNEAHILNCN